MATEPLKQSELDDYSLQDLIDNDATVFISGYDANEGANSPGIKTTIAELAQFIANSNTLVYIMTEDSSEFTDPRINNRTVKIVNDGSQSINSQHFTQVGNTITMSNSSFYNNQTLIIIL